MPPCIRKVKTASGAPAVQIAQTVSGRSKILEHLGSGHDDGELAVLVAAANRKIVAEQGQLDLGIDQAASGGGADAVITATCGNSSSHFA